MKASFFLALFLVLTTASFAQDADAEKPADWSTSDAIFDTWMLTSKPAFELGKDSLERLVAKSVKYPDTAIVNGISGTVKVEFTVERDGTLSDFKIIGEKLGSGLEEEALRVVKLTSGNWTPAFIGDQKVRAKHGMPIRFSIM